MVSGIAPWVETASFELTTTGAATCSMKSRFSCPSTCAAKLYSWTLHLLGIMTFSPSPAGPDGLAFGPVPPPRLVMIAGILSGSFMICFAIVPSTLYPVITTPFLSFGAQRSSNSRLTPFCSMPGLANITHPPTSSKRSKFFKLRMNLKSQGPLLPTSPACSASAIRSRNRRLILSFIAPTYV